MRRRLPAMLSSSAVVSRLIPVLALGAVLADCQNAERSVAPGLDGPQFSLSATEGLKGRIAFHSNRDGDFDIYVMNADGSGVRQLTHTTVHEFDPIWSPNGKRIAFARLDETGDFDVIVMNADGSGAINLTNNDVVNDFAGAWSPDGKRMAIASNRDGDDEVFIINLDGSGVTQLTHNDVRDFPTAWSPNGTQILFESNRDDDEELYVMNVDGSGVTRLTNNPGRDEGDRAGWSPNGKQIAFHSTRDGGDEDIFVMNADGTGVTQLTFNDGVFDAVPVWTAGGREQAAGGPCLSPLTGLKSWWPGDGDVGDLIGGNHGIGTFNVYVMTPRGAEQTQLTDGLGGQSHPKWSHDGRRITFSTCRPTDFSCEIYVMNADGSNATNLTQSPATDQFPAWSPGGNQIAFASDRDGNGEIYVMNVDGSRPIRLTHTPANEYYPAWSPTGSRIAFVSNRDGNYEIYVMKADGSAQQRLTNNPAWDADPSWAIDRADDQVLAFVSGDAKFAPAKVGEGFSFGSVGNTVFSFGTGINDLQQLTIDAWVKHNSLPPGRIQRYVTLLGS